MKNLLLAIVSLFISFPVLAAGTAPLPYVEIAPFKPKPNVTDKQLLAAIDGMEHSIRQFPGFLRRETIQMENGTWLDIVYWKDKNTAENALKLAETSEKCQRFFHLIDETEQPMQYGQKVRTQGKK